MVREERGGKGVSQVDARREEGAKAEEWPVANQKKKRTFAAEVHIMLQKVKKKKDVVCSAADSGSV